jgi:arylsulfatase A
LDRRTFLKSCALSVGAVSLNGCCKQFINAQEPQKPLLPNIVYILADDLGIGDVSCFNENGKINTHNIDSIAKAGIKFTDAHSGSSVCTPTRYGVMTGRYAWRTRLKNRVLGGWSKPLMKPDRMTVASMLKASGYNTGCVGKWHLGWEWALTDEKANTENWDMDAKNVDFTKPIKRGPRYYGFDYYFGISGSLDMAPFVYVENDMATALPDRISPGSKDKTFTRKGAIAPNFKHVEVLPKITEKAVNFVESQSADKPFFMYFPLTAPHKPILPSKEFQGKSGLNEWGDFVLQVDWTVGQVLDALKRKGFEDNTLVIITSDNGATPGADFGELKELGHNPSSVFRGFKADIFEGGHRVPFIAKWPGKIPPGSASDEVICLTDLMATAAEIVDYDLPDSAAEDSVSILPVLLSKNYNKPLREATVHHSINGSFSIRKGKWKLELCPGSGGWSSPRPNSKEAKPLPPIQLYNLETDIKEKTNLQHKHPDIVSQLTKLLQSYVDQGRSTPGKKQKNQGQTPITKKQN